MHAFLRMGDSLRRAGGEVLEGRYLSAIARLTYRKRPQRQQRITAVWDAHGAKVKEVSNGQV